MTCKHLRELYQTCERHNLKLSSTDLIRIVCAQCGVEEECPSLLRREGEPERGGESEGEDRDLAAEKTAKKVGPAT